MRGNTKQKPIEQKINNSQSELYKEVITAIVKAQAEVIGKDLALKKAAKVPGFTINPNFQVLSISDNPVYVIQSLVNEYYLLSSYSAIRISQKAIRKIVLDNPDLPLSQILLIAVEE